MSNDKKYQVFISSTYEDLKGHRDQAIQAVLDMGHIPIGMEMFSAADETQWAIISRQIQVSDYYVLLVAHRYGSTDAAGVSYTEKEYDYAASLGVPILAFVVADNAPWPNDQCESDTAAIAKLKRFKEKIKGRVVQFWKNEDDLQSKVSISLMKAITAYPRTGWVRADEVAGPELTKELTRLSSENADLRAALEKAERTKQQTEDEAEAAVRIIASNTRSFRVRKTRKWDEADRFTVSLLDVFEAIAPNLLGENSGLGVSQNIALRAIGKPYFVNFPVAVNVVADILADFVALNLIEPSKKKHPVSDTTDYWALTALGKKVHQNLRRIKLEAGMATSVSRESDVDEGSEASDEGN